MAKKKGLSWSPPPEEVEAVKRALSATWQAVAGDTLSAAGVQKMSREDVFDAVADYVDIYGRDKLGIKLFGQHEVYEYVSEHLAEFFPFKFYGY